MGSIKPWQKKIGKHAESMNITQSTTTNALGGLGFGNLGGIAARNGLGLSTNIFGVSQGGGGRIACETQQELTSGKFL